MWNTNFLIVLLSLVLQCHCANKETVKFGITNGTVHDSTNAIPITASSFAECISKCEQDKKCVLASQTNNTSPCYLYLYGYNIIVNKTNGEEGQVAFRLRTDEPACGANLPLLLNTKTYYLYANHSEEFIYVIETFKTYYTVTFEKIPMAEEDHECLKYFEPGEYKGGLETDLGFVTFPGYFIYNAMNHKFKIPFIEKTSNFKDCRQVCQSNDNCQAFWYLNGNCAFGVYGEIPLFTKTTINGAIVGIKLPFNNATCKMTPSQLFSNRNYPIFSKSPRPSTDPLYFTAQESSQHYALTYTSANNTDAQDGFWCKKGSCMMPILYGEGTPQSTSSDACKALSAKLVSPFYENADLNGKADVFKLNIDPKSWTSIKIKPECYTSTAAECQGDGKWTSEDIQFAEPGTIAKSWLPGQPNIEGIEPQNVCAMRLIQRVENSTMIYSCDSYPFVQYIMCVRAAQKPPTFAQVKAEWDALK